MSAILALDLGTQTGWAISGDLGIASGCQSFTPRRFEGGGMRYLRFGRWLNEVQSGQVGGIGAVWFEEVRRHLSTDSAHAYGGFMAVLTAWCEKHQIPYGAVPVGTIKKFATGKGNADKGAMIAAADKLLKIPVKDDNEADAVCLLFYVLSTERMYRTPPAVDAGSGRQARG